MIRVTELQGKTRYVNAEMIEFIESTPDTQLVMRDGRRVFVRETPEAIVEAVIAYKQRCGGPPRPRPPGGAAAGRDTDAAAAP